MKKMFFLNLLIIGTMVVNAQMKKSDSALIQKRVMTKQTLPETGLKKSATTTVNTPAASSSHLQTSTTNTSQQKETGGTSGSQAQADDNTQYLITGATVTIKTGNDSKEYPSRVQVYLFPMPSATYTYTYTLGQLNYTNHMVVGSSTELGLTPLNKKQIPWPVYYSSGYSGTNKASSPFVSGNKDWMLSDMQKQGFRLLVAYHPNIALDAWEIKQVIVKLTIQKADGTTHPTLNNKMIVFNINTPPLGVPTGMTLVCEADKNFSPATNYLTKDILID